MDQLGLFAKYWAPGRVKTRLAAGIGATAAAGVYRQFVVALLTRLRGLAARQTLCFFPPQKRAAFSALTDDWLLQPQRGENLGERIRNYFDQASADSCRRVVLLGTDSPNLPVDLVRQAFDALEERELALGPTEDGGFYLIGARGALPDVFAGVPWSTPHVWRKTMANIQRLGASCAELPKWYDVDDTADLQRLQREISAPNEPALVELRDAIRRQLRG